MTWKKGEVLCRKKGGREKQCGADSKKSYNTRGRETNINLSKKNKLIRKKRREMALPSQKRSYVW